MKIQKARKFIVILIISLFIAGTTQIGLSSSIKDTELVSQAAETKTSFNPFIEGWTYRKQIMIDDTQVSGDLSNFPVLIHIIDTDLKAKAQSDGDDILFMDGPGVANQLPHEIESYQTSNGELLAWVNIPTLKADEDTSFYMYYGNPDVINQQMPEQVWDQYFTGVWHLTDFYDSTLYENHGANYGSIASSGKIGNARQFDGSNDYILVDNDPSLNFHTPNKYTISVWMKRDRADTYESVISKGTSSTAKGYIVQIRENNTILVGLYDGYQEYLLHSNQIITDTNWHYITSVWDGTHLYIFIDGVLDNSVDIGAVTIADDSKPLEFGHHYGYISGQNPFDGTIDDIQIAKVNRNTDWVSTSYANQNAPSEFYSVGPEVPQEPPVKPQKPSGTIKGSPGTEYTFTTTTSDPDSNTLYYLWSWGDGNESGWYGPYAPNIVAGASHVWNEKGTYEIKVKAKDEHGAESEWSDPLSSKMPFTYEYKGFLFFERLCEQFPHAFPILRLLLGY
jgi:hypothetical protein